MLNFNTKPYYDDFNEDKNFHRILFKPGVAVQARELTQAQTILQDQIGKFGKFVLSDGSKVSGGKYTPNTDARSLNLADIGSIATDIQNFTGMYIVGETSKCVGLITSADVLNYYVITKPILSPNSSSNYISEENLKIFSYKDIALQYATNNSTLSPDYTAKLNKDEVLIISSGCYGQKDSYTFTINTQKINIGDVITAAIDNYNINYVVTGIGYDGTFTVHQPLKQEYNNTVALKITSFASNHVLEIGVSEGVYFTNNSFVKALPQTIIPVNTTQYPSCCIGFEVIESLVDYVDDSSLLDPAQGSYNYTAPGADRYKIYLNLVSKPLVDGVLPQDSLTTSKFIELLRIKNGVVVYDNTTPILGGLEDVLASQMYDHAGNFIVSPFKILFNESDYRATVTKLNATITPGKAYVFGYPFTKTYPTNLTIDKARETANSLNNSTSTYYGNYIRIKDAKGKLPIPTNGAKVALYSKDTSSATSDYRLGYAYVSNIDYTTTNEYGLYLHNIDIPEQKLAIANSVVGVGFSANTILTNGVNTITDTTFNKLLFKLPYSNPARIFDGSLTLDIFDTVSAASDVITISTGSLDKQFSSGTSSALPLELKNQNFILVARNTNGGYTAGDYINLNDVVIKVETLVSEYRATITISNGYTGQVDIKYSLKYTNPQQKTKTLVRDKTVLINVTTTPQSIGYADISRFTAIYKVPTASNGSAVYSQNWDIGLNYAANAVIMYNNLLYISTTSGNIGNTPGQSVKWALLENLIKNYKLNDGQKEFFYDHGTIAAYSQQNIGQVIVKFDYYEHSSGEYLSYQSYQQTDYTGIPSVKINNTVYDLRDYLDFRPRRKNVVDAAQDLQTLKFDSYNIPSTITDSNFYYDLSYYLGRIDKLFLTKDQKLVWEKGISSYRNYIPPKDREDALTIATIQLDPYTKDQSSINVSYAKHRRYTMDDIGSLDTRLKNVEYYTALTLGEKAVLNTNIIDQYGTRLKNGFIVDQFTNFSIVDLKTNNKNNSFDLTNNLVRPAHSFKTFPPDDAKHINHSFEALKPLKEESSLVYFPWTPETLLVQNQATSYTKINEFDCINYLGDLFLDPPNDIWHSKENLTVENTSEFAKHLSEANANPGDVIYGTWKSILAGFSVDTSASSTQKTNGLTDYTIGVQIKTTTDQKISEDVTAYVRSIPIKFRATGLAPVSKMYVYIDNKLMNGYITPSYNPMGLITSITIENAGAGYTSPTASLTATSTVGATFAVTATDGKIDSVTMTNNGRGYKQSTTHTLTITSTTTPTTQAVVTVNTIPTKGSDLYTDKYGDCSGEILLPEKTFHAGTLNVVISDTPHLNTVNSICKAQASFYTKYYKDITTITSIREPYIQSTTREPPKIVDRSNAGIIVGTEKTYTAWDYTKDFASKIRSGSLNFSIQLSEECLNNVVISYKMDPSKDKSSGVTMDPSVPSLTFTPSNWNVPQQLQISYMLGDSTANKINTLSSRIEFYGSSEDTQYHYISGSSAIDWTKGTKITGAAYCNLIPIKIEQKITIPPPTLTVPSTHTVDYHGNQKLFVSYYGTDTSAYPMTITATFDASKIDITGWGHTSGTVSKSAGSYAVTLASKDDNLGRQFDYGIYGITAGSTPITFTITSAADPTWIGLTGTTTVTVNAEVVTLPDPAIIILPSTESERITTSDGKTDLVGVKLSVAPPSTNNVILRVSSNNTSTGGEPGLVTDDLYSSTKAANSNVFITFTSTNWDKPHYFSVSGKDTLNNISEIDTYYRINLLAVAPSATNYINKTASVDIKNRDLAEGTCTVILRVGKDTFTSDGFDSTEAWIKISKKPASGQTVRVRIRFRVPLAGGTTGTSGSVSSSEQYLFFNSTTFDTEQKITITSIEQNFDYSCDMVCDSSLWDTSNLKTITDTFWEDTQSKKIKTTGYTYKTEDLVIDDKTRKYRVYYDGRDMVSYDDPRYKWAPSFTVVPGSEKITPSGGGTTWSTASPLVARAVPTPGSTKASFILSFYYASGKGGTDESYTNVNGSVKVEFNIQRAYDDCFISPHATIKATIFGAASQLVLDPNSENKQASIVPATQRSGITQVKFDVSTKCSKTEFEVLLTIDGCYFDENIGTTAIEIVDTNQTITTFRTDTYAITGTRTSNNTQKTPTVWNYSYETVKALYDSAIAMKIYDLLPPLKAESKLKGEYAVRSVDYIPSDHTQYYIDNLKNKQNKLETLITNIETKIKNTTSASIKSLLQNTLTQEQSALNAVKTELDKITPALVGSPVPVLSGPK